LDLYAITQPGADGIRRYFGAESVIDENARTRAKAFSSQARAICLMHSPDGFLLACSADSGVNAGAVVKQSLMKFGARGGGSATLAQGSLPDAGILLELENAIGR
jgi:alanyl-tRNA synthetase